MQYLDDPSAVSASDLDEPAPTADLVRVYLDGIGRTPLLSAEDEVELAQRIEVGVYAAELLRQAAAGEVRATAKRRAELGLLVADGDAAKNRMVRANLRLVVSIAKRYGHSGVPFLDIVQEGNLGLIRAVEKFDYRKGYKFSTYATWWVRQAIGRGLPENGRTIRLPVHIATEVAKVGRAERELLQSLGRTPTVEEIAEATGHEVTRVEELRRVGRETVSLDTPVGDDGDTALADLVVPGDDTPPTAALESQQMLAELSRAIERLPEREATIVRLRYGLTDGKARTMSEIGEVLGLSRERVRQLEREAMRQLRDPALNAGLLAWAS
jgi:RNA polymerase sigma factor (sigma-70 family)